MGPFSSTFCTLLPRALVLFSLCLLVPQSASAQDDPVSGSRVQRLQAELVHEARSLVLEVFGLHCPDRCSLLGVDAVVEEGEAVGRVLPGFEELGGGARRLVPRRVEISVLLDARLPPDFRRELSALLNARLRALSVPAVLRIDALPFPEPPPPEWAEEGLPPPGPVQQEPELPWPEAEQGQTFELWTELQKQLVGSAPWLLALLLIGTFALLLVGSWRGIRDSEAGRKAAPMDGRRRAEDPVSASSHGPAAAALVHRLGEQLRKNPLARQMVLRELLLEGDTESVALLVRLFGPSVADGLRDDPELRALLSQVAWRLRKSPDSGLDQENQTQSLQMLESRLNAARLELGDGSQDSVFSFADKLSPQQLASLVKESSPEAQVALLRHLSAHQRELLLRNLKQEERRELVAAIATSPVPDTSTLLQMAEDLRLRAESSSAGSHGGLELLVEVFESQDQAEQAHLLAGLSAQPQLREALLAQVCSESTLLAADDEVLAAVAQRVGAGTLVDFLRAAPSDLQRRFVDLSPRSTAEALKDELRLKGKNNPSLSNAARREVLSVAKSEILSRGMAIEVLNSRSDSQVGVSGAQDVEVGGRG